MRKSEKNLIFHEKQSVNGVSVFSTSENEGLWINRELAGHSFFPSEEIAQIKALACQLPAERGIPLSRFSITGIVREVISEAIVPSVSDSSVWRWLHEDAFRPWFHKSWIYPRDPKFIEKAGNVLDLYAKQWGGKPLEPNDYVISADEKTSIQARIRKHPTLPSMSRRTNEGRT